MVGCGQLRVEIFVGFGGDAVVVGVNSTKGMLRGSLKKSWIFLGKVEW